MIIAESESDKNCESAIRELSKSKPICQDIDKRKEKLTNTLAEKVGSLLSIEEIELVENMCDKIDPSVAAIRYKTLPQFQKKQTIVANKNIVPQRRLFSTKKKRSKNTTIKLSTDELNKNAVGLLLTKNNK